MLRVTSYKTAAYGDSQRSFDRAQRAYDSMLPPEPRNSGQGMFTLIGVDAKGERHILWSEPEMNLKSAIREATNSESMQLYKDMGLTSAFITNDADEELLHTVYDASEEDPTTAQMKPRTPKPRPQNQMPSNDQRQQELDRKWQEAFERAKRKNQKSDQQPDQWKSTY